MIEKPGSGLFSKLVHDMNVLNITSTKENKPLLFLNQFFLFSVMGNV